MRKITEEKLEEAISLYASGVSAKQVVRQLGLCISPSTLGFYVWEQGFSRTKHVKISAEIRERAIELYNEGFRVSEIIKKLKLENISKKTIYSWFYRNS